MDQPVYSSLFSFLLFLLYDLIYLHFFDSEEETTIRSHALRLLKGMGAFNMTSATLPRSSWKANCLFVSAPNRPLCVSFFVTETSQICQPSKGQPRGTFVRDFTCISEACLSIMEHRFAIANFSVVSQGGFTSCV